MATFVLVHGGMHGGWCWDYVAPLLEAAGHRVVAPNLPGMGGDPTPLHSVTLATQADYIARLIGDQRDPVVLVGHSMGGLVISEAAERVPARISGLIYVAAILVPGGFSMFSYAGAEMRSAHSGIIPSADGVSLTFDPAKAANIFYNTTAPMEIRRATARLTPQPIATTSAPLTVTTERYGKVRRAYVQCTQDHAIPLALQRRMQTDLPCDPVFTMETDHSPFLSAPDVLAPHLVAAALSFEPVSTSQPALGLR